VDGGGTKSEFLLADTEGKTVSRTVLGACNPIDIGLDAALNVLREGIDSVLGEIPPSCVSVFVGIAGGISGDNKQHIAAFLEKYNFAAAANGSDAENAVAASLGNEDGISVIAGTGSIAFVKKDGVLSRVGGHGYLIDEGGNGFSLGQAAIRAALLAEEGSLEEETLLYPMVKEKCERSTVLDAITEFYRGGKREIASYATIVFEAAEQGDRVALKIIEDNAACIARLIEAAGRRLKDEKITTAIVGGLTAKSDMLLPLIKNSLRDKERYEIKVFTGAPVKGAILLAGGKLYA
jgi:N-acetylglucosamine kinase-like BadF-type ATPase